MKGTPHIAILFAVACACKSGNRASPPPPTPAPSATASSRDAAASASASAAPSSTAALTSAPAPAPTREPGPTPPPPDGGSSECRLIYGPAQQPFKGAAALHAAADGVDVVFNDDGNPRVTRLPAPAIDANAKPAATRATSTANATAPACSVAASWAYCVGKTGDVVRTPLAGGLGKIIGAARAGSRIDATRIAGDHTIVAYLASRKTTEGWTSEAWAVVDEQAPVRISEPGSGATAVDLAPRGTTVVAMMVDARAALTPIHARVLTFADTLDVGSDAVVFIGGPPERHTASTVATPSGNGPAYALIPIAKSVSTFGMGAVRIDEPPQVDAPVVWSTYPNGLDPAPIAATQGHTPMRVARVRPLAAEPSSPKVLELGRLDANGVLVGQGILPTRGAPSDLALEVDAKGALWVAYTDAEGTWVERRHCP